MKEFTSLGLRYQNNKLEVLDQTLLPGKEEWIHCQSVDEMVDIIYHLKTRGAPLIGVAAAMALALAAENGASQNEILESAKKLNASRPTAVNLMMAMDRLVFKKDESEWTAEKIVQEAERIFDEDVELCQNMGKHGAELIKDGDNILTHCNTGGLATVGIGTALGVIRTAHEQGKKIHVYVDETRPLLQGGRLTTWELDNLGIPYTLICDNMAASLMRAGKIDKVFLGSDRVAKNGDFANKIGTYSVAVNAKEHGVEFYPVAPYTTIDFDCETGEGIPIEERKPHEVRGYKGYIEGENQLITWAPEGCGVFNPAFDVTPVKYVTGWVFDSGVYNQEQLARGEHLK